MAKQGEQTEHTEGDDAALTESVGKFFDKTVRGESRGETRAERRAAAAGESEEDDSATDDADEGDEDLGDDADDEGDAGDDADDEDPEEDDGEDADDDEAGDEEDAGDDDDEEGDEEDDDALDPAFTAAAERYRLPARFEDIVRTLPKQQQATARAAFGTRLKEMEGGFTRALQAARKEHAQLATTRAEKEWIEKNPIEFFIEQIEQDPKFADKLNAELEKYDTEAYREAKKMRREDAKKEIKTKAEQAAADAEAQEQRKEERITHVTRVAKTANREYGVPFRLIERALYVAITQSPTGDLSDAEIRRVVADEGKAYRKETGQRTRGAKQRLIRDKVAEQRAAARRPTGRDRGRSPAPGRVRPPKSLEEALTRRAATILPDAPAG